MPVKARVSGYYASPCCIAMLEATVDIVRIHSLVHQLLFVADWWQTDVVQLSVVCTVQMQMEILQFTPRPLQYFCQDQRVINIAEVCIPYSTALVSAYSVTYLYFRLKNVGLLSYVLWFRILHIEDSDSVIAGWMRNTAVCCLQSFLFCLLAQLVDCSE